MTKKNELLLKMVKMKSRIPNRYVDVFVEKYPEYNTKKKKDKIRSVVNLRSVDADIISKLETIAL